MSKGSDFTSADNCLSPVNISSTDPSIKECNIYCTYYYDYNDSSCIVSTNKNDPSGHYLEIKYDLKNSGTSPQVGFNGENYNVSSIRVYLNSLHTYDGQNAPVELLIFHDGPTYKGGNTKKLVVSIPYQSGTASSNYTSSKSGGRVLENIITDYYKLMPTPTPTPPASASTGMGLAATLAAAAAKSKATSTTMVTPPPSPQNLNINNFNLSNFIPNTQYYYYVAPDLPNLGVCQKVITTNYILFDLKNGGQFISSDSISKLQALISKSSFTIRKNALFKSAKFPNSDSIGAKANEIYIDCNPTGTEGEELYTPASDSQKEVSSISKMVEGLKDSGIVQFLASIIVSILLIWVLKKAFFKKSESATSFSSGGGASASANAGAN
jgi:hypothetical protein